LRIWVVALLTVTTIAGAWEYNLRAAGLGPEYIDNRALWTETRHRLTSDNASGVALLGASRHQRAIDVATMSKSLGRPVYQLSVEGTSALPTLENLAVDPRFRGTVIYSVAPAFSFNRRLSKLDGGNQAKWVRFYSDQSRVRRVEQRLRLLLQGALAMRSPDATVSRIIGNVRDSGRFPGPDHKTVYGDRSVHVDYAAQPGRPDRGGIVDLYLQNTEPYSDAEFQTVVNYFATLVRLLRQKGCDVFVVRLPSDKQVLALEQLMFPEARFWGAIERQTDATFVHFEDYPELNGYLSEDGSHIDSDRNAEFTSVLSQVLQANGL
jgi:hypothetical protein